MDRTARQFPRGGPLAGYRSRGARIAGIVFTGVWLLYLIRPVVDLFTGHYSALYTWGGLAIIVVFSAIYLILVPNWPSPYRYTLPGLAVLALLATARLRRLRGERCGRAVDLHVVRLRPAGGGPAAGRCGRSSGASPAT